MAFYENTIVAKQDLAEKDLKTIKETYNEIINNSSCFFELKTHQRDDLLKLLETHPNFSHIKIENDLITAFLENPMEAEEFNRLLFKNGIVLSHLVKRKESLEEQFLQLTDNK